tara:strand:- start:326 stop:676 length:351 start_codon:yes stop_codon:yes gene_type:complete
MKKFLFFIILFLIEFTFSCNSEEVEAKYPIPTQYTLTVTAGEGGTVAHPPIATYNEGETLTLTATADEGYVPDRWVGTDLRKPNCTSSIGNFRRHCRCIVTINSNRDIIAYFKKKE